MRIVRILEVISFIIMLCSTVVLADGLEKAVGGNRVGYEQIYISLPVYIVSLLATAGFIWKVAKSDNKKTNELKTLQKQMVDNIRAACKFPTGCEDCVQKGICKLYKLQFENNE
ncbi:MAG: hypothetical protein ABII09_03610 [Planctomycetota bacterium]